MITTTEGIMEPGEEQKLERSYTEVRKLLV